MYVCMYIYIEFLTVSYHIPNHTGRIIQIQIPIISIIFAAHGISRHYSSHPAPLARLLLRRAFADHWGPHEDS